MDAARDRGYPFTDPVGAVAAATARTPRWRMRRAWLMLSWIAAVTLALTLQLPDSDLSDHAGIALVMAATIAQGTILFVWKRPADWFLLGLAPAGTVAVSVLVAVAKPIALIPLFYIWPIVISAYHLQRREVILNYLFVLVGFGVALWGWAEPDARLIMWVSLAIIGGTLAFLVVILKDGLNIMMQRLEILATHDSLTGALNRRAFGERIDEEVARAARTGKPCALAILDVDHFKSVNDRFGHAAGDAALVRLAELVSGRLRSGDAFGRLGGEEFAVLLVGTDVAGARDYSESLRQLIAADQSGTPLTVSIGVAGLVDDAETMQLAADRALYRAKAEGRDRVLVG